MANLTETSSWESNVYQIDDTDPVQGGSDTSIDNLPHLQLAKRTQYLKARLDDLVAQDQPRGIGSQKAVNAKFVMENSGRFANVFTVTSGTSAALDNTALGAAFVFMQSAHFAVTLPQVAAVAGSYYRGQGISFINNSNKVVTINAFSGNKLKGVNLFGNNATAENTFTYLMPGEELFLINDYQSGVGYWYACHARGNFATVGEIVYHPAAGDLLGLLQCKGQLVNRADYPRLWLWAVATSSTVADADWSAATTPGKFSQGNGNVLSGTTFRLPDLRGLFIRSVDLSAGIDSARTLGSYQADAFKAHTHTVPSETTGGSSGVGATGADHPNTTITTSSTGDSETRPVNVALTACIRY